MKNISLILLLVSAMLYGLVIRDYQEKTIRASTKLQNLEREIIVLKAELKSLEGQEESLGTALDLAYERIPPQNEQENLIRDIQKISKDTGFAFQGLGFAQSFNADMNVPQLVVNFNVRGAYAQLFAFLRSVEQNPRLLGMNNIRLTMSEDRDLGRQVSTDLAVYALYQE